MAKLRGAVRGKRQHGIGPRVDVEQKTKDRGLIQTSARLTEDEYTKGHAAAAGAGLSFSGYIAMLIRRDEVDEEGRPLWAEEFGAEQLPLEDAKVSAA
jgi:hypothetical protein